MNVPLLRVAVVGHTNTGKTSLLRTLTRNADFGEVSDRPATTRRVEGAAILVDGREIMQLYDTPGLEDSSSLIEHLENLRGGERAEGLPAIERFLDSAEARDRFAQEAKALRQVLAVDVALYVIDSRDPVLGKHRDELEILGWCAKPVVPALNFIAGESARTTVWREHLARVGMHAVAEFDTVVFDDLGEERLYEKMQSLLDGHRDTLSALIRYRRTERTRLVRASARIIADLLLDTAADTRWIPDSRKGSAQLAIEDMKCRVRDLEKKCVSQLLELHRFHRGEGDAPELSAVGGETGLDLFSPNALRQFGLIAGRGAAIGALAGMAADVMVGGMSLGAATAAGAGIGALAESLRTQGHRLLRRAQGSTPLRCDDATIRLLALRQITFTRALLHRGHASQSPIESGIAAKFKALARQTLHAKLPRPLEEARLHPGWSSMSAVPSAGDTTDLRRQAARDRLADALESILKRPTDQSISFP